MHIYFQCCGDEIQQATDCNWMSFVFWLELSVANNKRYFFSNGYKIIEVASQRIQNRIDVKSRRAEELLIRIISFLFDWYLVLELVCVSVCVMNAFDNSGA